MIRLLLFLLLSLACQAQSPAWVPVYLGEGHSIDPPALQQALQTMRQAEPKPQHIVFLFHGYNVPRESSQKDYDELAQRIQDFYKKAGLRPLIVGLQWESAEPGNLLPWQVEESYLKVLGRGRSLGRDACRQVVLATEKQYPKVPINFLCHSMGCEVAVATFLPAINYVDEIIPGPAFEPKRMISPNFVGLAGSDLDYDLWYKSNVDLGTSRPIARMMWMTQSDYIRDRDKTLAMRSTIRGDAGGTFFPRMTEKQYDLLFKNRAVMFDDEDIPRGHEFTRYYDENRLERMLTTAVFVANPKAPKPLEVVDADRILKLPARPEVLRPWLDNEHVTAQMYALWRLEQIFTGSSKHFADESLDKVHRMLRKTPSEVWKEQKRTEVRSIREGYWPTETQMTRAGAPAWARPQD